MSIGARVDQRQHWRDRTRGNRLGTTCGVAGQVQPGAAGQGVIIKVLQPKVIAKYYKGTGTIDRHTTIQAGHQTLGQEVHPWCPRLCLCQCLPFFQQIVGASNRTTSCLEFFGRLADKIIDNQ
ncbi:hypothetical protein ACHAW5_011264 [Stephanodiscus triporus]|uniref:Uncharacterized protein n=1 Tax=Stephanodiscus triporus TaxID=2934178 RepID=A0ABD3PR88_9STRA